MIGQCPDRKDKIMLVNGDFQVTVSMRKSATVLAFGELELLLIVVPESCSRSDTSVATVGDGVACTTH
eukprot:41149-Eustigmatos_ZCMA.PRE.1